MVGCNDVAGGNEVVGGIDVVCGTEEVDGGAIVVRFRGTVVEGGIVVLLPALCIEAISTAMASRSAISIEYSSWTTVGKA